MARKRERAFAAFGAALFLITSSALTIAVVMTMVQQSKDNKANNKQETNKVDNSKKLAGTPLKDFTPVPQITELKTEDKSPGNGQEAKATDTVTVLYTGALAKTGIIFESTQDSGQPATFPLNQVIKGWTEGIPGMKVGGTRRLYIPAALAYGAQSPSPSIPANSDLVFDVTLLKVGK